jgi:hypothetical protein
LLFFFAFLLGLENNLIPEVSSEPSILMDSIAYDPFRSRSNQEQAATRKVTGDLISSTDDATRISLQAALHRK